MTTKDLLLLLLGTGGLVAWAKPLKDLIQTSSRARRVKTKDLVTSLNDERQTATDDSAFFRDLAQYWQGYAADVVYLLRKYGHKDDVPEANPPKKPERKA